MESSMTHNDIYSQGGKNEVDDVSITSMKLNEWMGEQKDAILDQR
jgi:hypothetical protein